MTGESVDDNRDPWLLNAAILATAYDFDSGSFFEQPLNVSGVNAMFGASSLESLSDEQREAVEDRYDLLSRYRDFEDVVNAITAPRSDGKQLWQISPEQITREYSDMGVLGVANDENGTVVTVHVVIKDREYDFVMSRFGDSRRGRGAGFVESQVRGAEITHGLPGRWRKIQAISYEQGVIVGEHMEGRPVAFLNSVDLKNITDEQINRVIPALVKFKDLNAFMLYGPKHVLYDQTEGFAFTNVYGGSRPGLYGMALEKFPRIFLNAGVNRGKPADVGKALIESIELMESRIDLLERYSALVQDSPDVRPEDKAAVRLQVERFIDTLRKGEKRGGVGLEFDTRADDSED